MILNYYDIFIKPKDIRKDINFFYDKIKELVCNDLFPKYLRDRKKKEDKSFNVKNFLSEEYKTKLQFIEDNINIEFKSDVEKKKRSVLINDIQYKSIGKRNYKIKNINIDITIYLSKLELKSKKIYDDNIFFHELRKTINQINNKYNERLLKSEISTYKYIHNKIKNIKPSSYQNWNKLLNLIKNITDPSFEFKLKMFKEIINGFYSSSSVLLYMIHQTEFFKKYEKYNQINKDRFIRKLMIECEDDAEIITLANNLSMCFGYKITSYEESIDFLKNIIDHFNFICNKKEKNINEFVLKYYTYSRSKHRNKEIYDKHLSYNKNLSWF